MTGRDYPEDVDAEQFRFHAEAGFDTDDRDGAWPSGWWILPMAIVAGLFWIAVAAIVTSLMMAPVEAHTAASGWTYDAACCSGRDCTAMPLRTVTATAKGWHVVVRPGEHHLFPGALDVVVPWGDPRLRASGDTEFHLCLNRAGSLLCLYVPPMGS